MKLMGRLHPDGSITDIRYVSDFEDQTGMVPVREHPRPAEKLVYDPETREARPAQSVDRDAALRRVVYALATGGQIDPGDLAAIVAPVV